MAIELMSPYWEELWKAVHVQSREEADATLEKLIKWCRREDPRMSYEEARTIQLSNVGWMFGELDHKRAKHAMEMWPEASHPVTGRSFHNLDTLLKTGEAIGQALKEGKDLATAVKEAQERCLSK